MKLTFKVENWFECVEEMRPLWDIHWQEVALNQENIKLNVWESAFENAAKLGQLHVVVARFDGEIVGYHVSLIRPHLHYQGSLTAYTDAFYLHPDHRKGFNGLNLFKAVEKTLKDRGVERIIAMTKVKFDSSKKINTKKSTPDKSIMFERLGFTFAEKIYTKFIG